MSSRAGQASIPAVLHRLDIVGQLDQLARGARRYLCCPSLIVLRGFSASEAGLVFLPIGLIIGLASRSAGRWADRVGPRLPLILGSATVALAAILLALSPATLWLGAVGPILLMAIGMAMVVAPLTTAVMNAVPEAQSGIASAVNNAASRIAGLISVVIVGLAASLLYRHALQSLSIHGTQELRFGVLPDLASPQQGLRSNPRFFTPIRWRC